MYAYLGQTMMLHYEGWWNRLGKGLLPRIRLRVLRWLAQGHTVIINATLMQGGAVVSIKKTDCAFIANTEFGDVRQTCDTAVRVTK